MISRYCQAIREKYCGQACTLNGHPATVTGRKLNYAQVARLDTAYGAVEFSWQTVGRVMESDKGFKNV